MENVMNTEKIKALTNQLEKETAKLRLQVLGMMYKHRPDKLTKEQMLQIKCSLTGLVQ